MVPPCYDVAVEDINRKLEALHDKQAQLAKLRGLVEHVQDDLDRTTQRRDHLRTVLAKEQKDVDRLTGFSLTAIFHTLMSSKTEQLDKERQELVRVKLRFDEADGAVKSLENDLRILWKQVEQIGDLSAEREKLMAEREAAVLASDPYVADQVHALTEQIADAKAMGREIREASHVGGFALASLDKMIDCLSSARSWGTYDLVGGGFVASSVKHSNIDLARGHAHRAQKYLRRFKNELADVSIDTDLSIEIGEFEKFTDFFFDNLITDYVVQRKIVSSLGNAEEVRRKLRRVLRSLRTNESQVEKRIKELGDSRRSIIETA